MVNAMDRKQKTANTRLHLAHDPQQYGKAADTTKLAAQLASVAIPAAAPRKCSGKTSGNHHPDNRTPAEPKAIGVQPQAGDVDDHRNTLVNPFDQMLPPMTPIATPIPTSPITNSGFRPTDRRGRGR